MKKRIQVFVSHTQSDAALARRLAADLAAAGLGIWIAPNSILPGEGWVDAINRGLEESSDVVVLLTPSAVESMWVRQEVSAAIALERKDRIRLIPLEVEQCEMPPLWEAYQKISLMDYDSGADQLKAVLARKKHRELPPKVEGRISKSSGESGVGKTSTAELDFYAQLYDALYSGLAIEHRNYVLNAVFVDQIFQLGSSIRPSPAVVTRLFARGSDGDRMVALLLLQTVPSVDCLDWAIDAIKNPRSPFEQYHGLRSVDLMTHLLNEPRKQKLIRVLKHARGKFLIPANQSRWSVYLDISKKLSTRHGTTALTRSTARSTRRPKKASRTSTVL